LLLAVLVAALNLARWGGADRPTQVVPWNGQVAGFAYSPFQRYQSPLAGNFPSDAEVASDLALMARHTRRVRVYSVLQYPEIPRLAMKDHLDVMAGAWLDRRDGNNEKEIAALIAQARRRRGAGRTSSGSRSAMRCCCAPT
jgi:exo-beta-1,3-glucanase (GH17 family)